MPPLSLQRSPKLNYHYEEGKAWLADSEGGKNTTALSYAAFEFRLAIERIGLQYWSALTPGGIEEISLRDIKSFKSVEKRVYQLAGHQRKIEARFEFARILLSALKIDWLLITPKLSQLSSAWHECSELCHVAWSLVSEDEKLAQKAFAALEKISAFLESQLSGVITWARVFDMPFRELEEKFISGQATADDVRKHLEDTGAWARIKYTDGRPSKFIGEAIPPAAKKAG